MAGSAAVLLPPFELELKMTIEETIDSEPIPRFMQAPHPRYTSKDQYRCARAQLTATWACTMAGASSTLQDSGIEDSLNGEHVKAQGFANIAKDQPIDNLELFQRERDLLDLWDRLNDLKLELEILEAQEGLSNGLPPPHCAVFG